MKSLMAVAQGRLDRAQQLLSEIGDHGVAFEESLSSGKVTAELASQVRQVAVLLRSALDQAARALVAGAGWVGGDCDVVFPVAPRGSTQADFAAQLRAWLPNGLQLELESIAALNSAQPFFGSDWLLDLDRASAADGLVLAVKRVPFTQVETARQDGSTENRLVPAPKSSAGNVLLLQPTGGGSQDAFEAVCVLVEPAGEDVLVFLEEAVRGVRGVVSRLGA